MRRLYRLFGINHVCASVDAAVHSSKTQVKEHEVASKGDVRSKQKGGNLERRRNEVKSKDTQAKR